MPVSITPVSVPGSAAVPLGAGLPAGPFHALLTGGTAATNGIYVGIGTASTTTGMYFPGGAPVPLPPGFAGAAGPTALYAIAGSGTVTAVLMVSTPR